MKSFFALVTLILIGVAGWRIGGQLSSDALGMALGILFGVMASIPTALIVLAARRRADEEMDDPHDRRRHPNGLPMHGYPSYQPPVIVVTGNPTGQSAPHPYGMTGYDQPRAALPMPMDAPPQGRQFRVVGETDEWVEEW